MSQVKRVKGKWTCKHLRWRGSQRARSAVSAICGGTDPNPEQAASHVPVTSGLSREPPRQPQHLCSAGGLRRDQLPPPGEGRAGSRRCKFSGGRAASKQCPARGEWARGTHTGRCPAWWVSGQACGPGRLWQLFLSWDLLAQAFPNPGSLYIWEITAISDLPKLKPAGPTACFYTEVRLT